MKITVKLSDGTFSVIPNVRWHSSHPTGNAELWVRESDVIAHLRRINAFRAKHGVPERDLSVSLQDIIVCGEAAFAIYGGNKKNPWLIPAEFVCEIPYDDAVDWPNA